ncbi:MAG TPA: 4-hydroxy-tetrahydrodipicolinate reductase [Firmicutes bacterium]|jgi:4-hydroxy-tetrahydrodipicolinate reductase|nr:4-hydroxy-tetrahydrodipicolinate reductase [Bacillota bacterium]
MDNIRVLVNGACGRMGREVVKAVVAQADLELVGAVDKVGQGQEIGQVCGLGDLGITVERDLAAALRNTTPTVVVDFTTPLTVMDNIKATLEAGVAAVVGTTGLTSENLEEIAELAVGMGKGIIVAPNFALGAVLMMRFAQEAARYFPDVEIIELHHDRKIDAPSGTALKTAELIAAGRVAEPGTKPAPLEKINGARGGEYLGTKIHSLRLPGLIAHQEVIFGAQGQTLTIRHDSLDRSSFMPGVILAVRKAPEIKGLVYGLDALID